MPRACDVGVPLGRSRAPLCNADRSTIAPVCCTHNISARNFALEGIGMELEGAFEMDALENADIEATVDRI